MPGKLEDHLPWMTEHQLSSPVVDNRRVEVAERVAGHEPLFQDDKKPATVEEIDLAVAMLRANHDDLVGLLNDAPQGFLSWDPPYRQFASWADWRTVAATLAHMANAESHYYLPMIGYETPANPSRLGG